VILPLVSAGYLAASLLGCLLLIPRENREYAFYRSNPPWLGHLNLIHAFAVVAVTALCGITLLVKPSIAPPIAWISLGMLVLGKAIAFLRDGRIRQWRTLLLIVSLYGLGAFVVTSYTK
jgi:hypothetical protein